MRPTKEDREKVARPIEEARTKAAAREKAAAEEKKLASLPSFRDLESGIQTQARLEHDAQRKAFKEDLERNQPIEKRLNLNNKECMRCHPQRKDDFKLGDLDLWTPPKVTAKEVAGRIDQSFEAAAKGMNRDDRASLADRYSTKIAGDPTARREPYDRFFGRGGTSDPKEALQASNDFRLREAERMRAAAKSLPPDQRAAALQRADELVRRPITPGADQFLRAVERTPANQLSMNDLTDATQLIRHHKAADHDQYSRATGLKPGNDDMFVRDEHRLFDANRERDLEAAKDRLRMLNSKECMRCHPQRKDDFKLDLRGFGGKDDLFGRGGLGGKTKPTDPWDAEQQRIDGVIDKHLANDPRFGKLNTESAEYKAERARLRAEHDQLQRIRANPNDPTARLKLDPSKLTAEQKKILEDHQAAYRLNQLDQKVRGPYERMRAEYENNKWGEDSRFFGVNNQAFLADLAGKDPKTISRPDAFRGLRGIDDFRGKNPDVFKDQAGDFRSSREKGNDLYYRDLADIRRAYDTQLDEAKKNLSPEAYAAKKKELDQQFDARKKSIEEDANNPFSYLRRPVAELDDKAAKLVNGDYTRYNVEKLERTLRGQALNGLGDQVDRLDRHFAYMLDHTGIVGGGANWLKNHIGTDGGWIVDSNLGSDAVKKTIQDSYVARDQLRNLANFKGTNEDFIKQFQDKTGNLHKSLQDVERHIGKFKQSQENWVEGVSTAVSVIGAAAAAAATGGAAAPLLVGAIAGAGLKVGVKGADAITGGHAYQGSIGIDLLKGGLNGVTAAGTGMLANYASKSMLSAATARLAAGESLSLATRGGIFFGTAAAEGVVDGYISGTGSALLDGKSLGEANKEGLQGAAFGAVLGPVGRGSMKGLEFLWKSGVRPKGLPKDIQVDWRGRPIDAEGNLLDLKKDWRGNYVVPKKPGATVADELTGGAGGTGATGTRTGAPDTVPDIDIAPPQPRVRQPTPLDAPPGPYKELPKATGKPTADSLTARVDGYTQVHDPHFTQGMGKAIDDATQALEKLRAAQGGKVAPEQVDEILKKIGQQRQKLQHEKVDRDAAKAASEGQPWSADKLERMHKHADDYGRPLPEMNTNGGSEMWDQILPNNRHKAYMDRAADAFEVMERNGFKNTIEIDINGVKTEVPLSVVARNPWNFDGYVTVHPNFDKSRLLSNRANQLFAEVLTDATMTEAQAFRKIAEANYLMMHGTPFMLGSPASIEALNDAVMRARFGKTFPNKKPGVEPFWEAMFAPPGQAGMNKYIDAYRGFYE